LYVALLRYISEVLHTIGKQTRWLHPFFHEHVCAHMYTCRYKCNLLNATHTLVVTAVSSAAAGKNDNDNIFDNTPPPHTNTHTHTHTHTHTYAHTRAHTHTYTHPHTHTRTHTHDNMRNMNDTNTRTHTHTHTHTYTHLPNAQVLWQCPVQLPAGMTYGSGRREGTTGGREVWWVGSRE